MLKVSASDARYNLGLAYLQTGRDSDAIEVLSELIKIDSTYWDAYYQLAKVLIKGGDNTTARALLENLMAKKSDYSRGDEVRKLLAKL